MVHVVRDSPGYRDEEFRVAKTTKKQFDVAKPGWLDKLLSYMDVDDPEMRRSKVHAFQLIFVVFLCAEHWQKALGKLEELDSLVSVQLSLAMMFGYMALFVRSRQLGFSGLAVVHVLVLWNSFPWSGNHRYLEFILCVFLAFLNGEKEDEQKLLLNSLRWMVVVVFFYSGLQKLVNGYYFNGEFLAFSFSRDSFRTVLGTLLPADELARLASYSYYKEVGDGPFIVTNLPLLIVSNSIYVSEIGLALLLFIRKTRRFGVIAAIVFLVGTEAIAREFFFGAIFANMILLFFPSDLNRKLMPFFLCLLVVMGLVFFGVIPEMYFD